MQPPPDGSAPEAVPGCTTNTGRPAHEARWRSSPWRCSLRRSPSPSCAGSDARAAGRYLVRAIFDNAAFAVRGEDVRIAGANVGSIQSLDVTKDKKAAVTFSIDDARLHAVLRQRHLLDPPPVADRRALRRLRPGQPRSRRCPRIRTGPGAGSYYLPVAQTNSPVDSDIVQDIYRLPIRERSR